MLNELLTIVNMYPLKQEPKDTWRWKRLAKGVYCTKEVYDALAQQGEEVMEYKMIWNKMCPSKVSIHAWRVIRERVPMTSNLHR
ncbi:hypothetical protein ACS0TY_022196 [Phlomoides rotata]